MSLRTRLVLVLGSLAVAGLLVADVTTYYSLRSFLVQRVAQYAARFLFHRASVFLGTDP